MPLDPQVVQVMEAMAALGLPPADTVELPPSAALHG